MTRGNHTEDDLLQFKRNMEPKVRAGVGVEPQRAMTRERAKNIADTGTPSASPTKSKPYAPYSSKWEASYANKLELEKRAGLIKAYYYEPFSLWLPGKVRYKPDFMVQYADQPLYPTHICAEPRLEIIEVKGWSKNRRDGITRLKIAAALFPCFTWRMVWMKKGGGFDGEYI